MNVRLAILAILTLVGCSKSEPPNPIAEKSMPEKFLTVRVTGFSKTESGAT